MQHCHGREMVKCPVITVIHIPMTLLTLGTHAQDGYSSCLVSLSVKSHLTFGTSVCSENTVAYSVGNGGQKVCGVFSETTLLQRSRTPSVEGHIHVQSTIFLWKVRMLIICVLWFMRDYWAYTVIDHNWYMCIFKLCPKGIIILDVGVWP